MKSDQITQIRSHLTTDLPNHCPLDNSVLSVFLLLRVGTGTLSLSDEDGYGDSPPFSVPQHVVSIRKIHGQRHRFREPQIRDTINYRLQDERTNLQLSTYICLLIDFLIVLLNIKDIIIITSAVSNAVHTYHNYLITLAVHPLQGSIAYINVSLFFFVFLFFNFFWRKHKNKHIWPMILLLFDKNQRR